MTVKSTIVRVEKSKAGVRKASLALFEQLQGRKPTDQEMEDMERVIESKFPISTNLQEVLDMLNESLGLEDKEDCPQCQGTGLVGDDLCPSCKGTGNK